MDSPPLRALVVDDSAIYRKILRSVLEQIPGVEVIGAASDGRLAVDRIVAERPDLITLDLEMPRLDGLGVLRELAAQQVEVCAIVVSTLTATGAEATSQALHAGAFDFVLKPAAAHLEASAMQLQEDLGCRIKEFRAARLRRLATGHAIGARPATTVVNAPSAAMPRKNSPLPRRPPEVIGIGVSTGGPVALRSLLRRFPADYPNPILVVQHMPPLFTKSLADDLNRICPLNVVEAWDDMPVEAGTIAIAPGGRQMRVSRVKGRAVLVVNEDAPERNCRPSVDYLFRSLAQEYGELACGVILTGMGDDGTLGANAMKAAGAQILAQDEASCVVYGMPRAVALTGIVDFVGTLDELATRLNATVREGALS